MKIKSTSSRKSKAQRNRPAIEVSKKGTAVSFAGGNPQSQSQEKKAALISTERAEEVAEWLAQVHAFATKEVYLSYSYALAQTEVEPASVSLMLAPSFEFKGTLGFEAALHFSVAANDESLSVQSLEFATQLAKQVVADVWADSERAFSGFHFQFHPLSEWKQLTYRIDV